MKILLTGANGYIGKRLLPVLVANGHKVTCCVRDSRRFNPTLSIKEKIEVVEVDFLNLDTLQSLHKPVDAAFYLMHSMSSSSDYANLEIRVAKNFREWVQSSGIKQVIYLSGIVNENSLSEHLKSRKAVEEELALGDYSLTTLRAGIIIGSGSASFEIIRDLVEKLPVMIAPRWLDTRCQPIAITDVLSFLTGCLGNKETFNRNFDVGGPDILTYKEMLMVYAEVRSLKRYIFTVPVMTPRLSSYWLYFVTSTSFKLALALVDSMKVEVVCRDSDLNEKLGIKPMTYKQALESTFSAIGDNQVLSSWKDSLVSGRFEQDISELIHVPTYGCLIEKRSTQITSSEKCRERIWKIGGETGWYYANWLWKFRGFIDRIFGGVGLRRGRTHPELVDVGDAIDFWRVLYSNREEGRLLLFAEMKLPGEAWLEFNIVENTLIQTATFRPKGILGRLYWYAVWPFHGMVFDGLLNKLTE
ncbi:MAG: SDR family oxidoreductase [Saprospiraceae bacterium]|nr:SDR family oxidoreductase [Saprospiraceae bacterium]